MPYDIKIETVEQFYWSQLYVKDAEQFLDMSFQKEMYKSLFIDSLFNKGQESITRE